MSINQWIQNQLETMGYDGPVQYHEPIQYAALGGLVNKLNHKLERQTEIQETTPYAKMQKICEICTILQSELAGISTPVLRYYTSEGYNCMSIDRWLELPNNQRWQALNRVNENYTQLVDEDPGIKYALDCTIGLYVSTLRLMQQLGIEDLQTIPIVSPNHIDTRKIRELVALATGLCEAGNKKLHQLNRLVQTNHRMQIAQCK